MTIGLILECGPQGADKLVCEYLATHIRPGVKVASRTLDNKKDLLVRQQNSWVFCHSCGRSPLN